MGSAFHRMKIHIFYKFQFFWYVGVLLVTKHYDMFEIACMAICQITKLRWGRFANFAKSHLRRTQVHNDDRVTKANNRVKKVNDRVTKANCMFSESDDELMSIYAVYIYRLMPK